MPPNQQNPYDFILSPQQQQQRKINIGGSWPVRIALIIGALIILIVLFSVVNSLLSSGKKAQTQRLTDIAVAQSELIRVGGLGANKAKTIETRTFAVNTQLSTISAQKKVRETLIKRGVSEKALNKTLEKSKNTKTDSTLTEAGQNNRYDETFTTLMTKQITDYQKLLKAAYDGSSSKTEKTALEKSSKVAATLIKKPAATTPSTTTNTPPTTTTPAKKPATTTSEDDTSTETDDTSADADADLDL